MMFFIPLPFIVLSAQQEQPVFRGGITLVRVDAQVVDRRGRVVAGLKQQDFQVFDENQPVKISHFAHESEPLDLLLLLDISGSMHRFLAEMAETAHAAMKPLLADDRVAVMLFARETAVREPFTNNFAAVAEEIRQSIHDRSLGGGTAINAAMLSAANYMQRQPVRGRRAILIVTDNQSLNYKVPDEDVIRALLDADTVLDCILIGKHRKPDPVKPGRYVNPDFSPSDVFKVAGETGGEGVDSGKIGQSFAEMIDRIRSRYAIEYVSPGGAAGEFRHIRVEVRQSGTVRARSGYYVK